MSDVSDVVSGVVENATGHRKHPELEGSVEVLSRRRWEPGGFYRLPGGSKFAGSDVYRVWRLERRGTVVTGVIRSDVPVPPERARVEGKYWIVAPRGAVGVSMPEAYSNQSPEYAFGKQNVNGNSGK